MMPPSFAAPTVSPAASPTAASGATGQATPDAAASQTAAWPVRLRTSFREVGQLARREKAWLWLLLPYLFAWIVPATWSRDQWGNPNHPFSFQPFVPFLAGLIVWSQRKTLSVQKTRLIRQMKSRDWRLKSSSIVLVLGLLLFLFSHIVQVKGFVILSLWLVAVGTIWRVYDGLTVGLLWKPLAFALLVIPPPDSVIDASARRLQIQSVTAATILLQKLHLATDASSTGWTMNLKGTALEISTACSGMNTVLPLLVFFATYLIYVKAPVFRSFFLLFFAGILSLGANVVRIMAVALLQPPNPGLSNTVNYANTYLLIVPLFLLLVACDRMVARRGHSRAPSVQSTKIAGGTLRVAAGTGVAVGLIFRPLEWLVNTIGRSFKIFKYSERGLEKLLSRLTPKKKKRNRW